MLKLSTIAGICRKHDADFQVRFTPKHSFVAVQRDAKGKKVQEELLELGVMHYIGSISWLLYSLESLT